MILLPALALTAVACVEWTESDEAGEGISFEVATLEAPVTKAASNDDYIQLPMVTNNEVAMVAICNVADMGFIEEEVEVDEDEPVTKATRYNSESEFALASQTFKIWGWNTASTSSPIYNGATVSKSGTSWIPAGGKKWVNNNEYCFEAVYPDATGFTSFTTNPTNPASVTFAYAHGTNAAAPYDYMLAYFKDKAQKSKKAKLTFTHPFTCVKFASGNGVTVNSVKLEGLYASGTCAVSTNTATTGDYYTYTWTPGASTHVISNVAAGAELLLIPQNLNTKNVTLTVNVTVNGVTFDTSATLDKATESSNIWEAGKVYTYNFGLGQDVQVKVTDTVVGKLKNNVKIKNTGTAKAYIRAAIVAGWYDDNGMMVAPWTDSSPSSFTGLPGTKWVLGGGNYYYYKDPVPGGEFTGHDLFTSYDASSLTPPVEGAHLEMTILAQAVLWDTDKANAKLAWGTSTVNNAELN